MRILRRIFRAIRDEAFVMRYSGNHVIPSWNGRDPEIAKVHRIWGFKVGWEGDTTPMKHQQCEHCTEGDQVLLTRKDGRTYWGPATKAMRDDDPWGIGIPPGNSRTCDHCLGLGYRWRKREEKKELPT